MHTYIHIYSPAAMFFRKPCLRSYIDIHVLNYIWTDMYISIYINIYIHIVTCVSRCAYTCTLYIVDVYIFLHIHMYVDKIVVGSRVRYLFFWLMIVRDGGFSFKPLSSARILLLVLQWIHKQKRSFLVQWKMWLWDLSHLPRRRRTSHYFEMCWRQVALRWMCNEILEWQVHLLFQNRADVETMWSLFSPGLSKG